MASNEAFNSGVWSPQVVTPELDKTRFQPGQIAIAEEVDRAIELLDMAGGVGDKVKARDVFTADLVALNKTGIAMRIVPDVPGGNLPWDSLVALMDGKRPEGVDEASQWPELWKNPESLITKQLGGTATRVALRGFLLNAQPTGLDPVLHHSDLPADEYARQLWNPDKFTTQKDEVASDVAAFVAAFPELDLRAGNHRDFAFGVAADRVNRVPTYEQLFAEGWMRAIDLGRHAVAGGSVVPDVDSSGGLANFVWDDGGAYPLGGVGLSAGRKI